MRVRRFIRSGAFRRRQTKARRPSGEPARAMEFESVTRFLAILLVPALLLLSACETVKGVGRDVEKAGEALDEVF